MKLLNGDFDNKRIYEHLDETLTSRKIKHQGHAFPSGYFMLDIWYMDSLYVIQIEHAQLGFSKITEDSSPFDVIPDDKFLDYEKFKNELYSIFS